MNNSAHNQPISKKSSSSKRDYNLIIGGKYNLKAIMQRAWAYVRMYSNVYTFKSALKQSWCDARLKLEEYYGELRFNEALDNGTLFPEKDICLYSNPCGNLAMGYVCK